MKKIYALLFVVILAAGLAACGGEAETRQVSTPAPLFTPAPIPAPELPELELRVSVVPEGVSIIGRRVVGQVDYRNGEGIGDTLMISANVPLRDFGLVKFYVDFTEDGWLFILVEILATIDELSPDDAFVITSYTGAGTLPQSGVTFVDPDGQRRYFAMQHDNSLGLDPSPFLDGFVESFEDGVLQLAITNGAGARRYVAATLDESRPFDPEVWFVENAYLWADYAVVIWEVDAVQAPDYVTIRGEQFSTSLTRLDFSHWGLTNEDILPLRYMVHLEELTIANDFRNRCDTFLSDITPLAGLTNLTTLNLRGNNINDITPLANMAQLADLSLGGNQISNIASLAELIQLRYLDIMDNQISDVTALTSLPNLVFLDAVRNQIADVTPLATLTNLDFLGLSANPINNIAPLANLTNLTRLTLEDNQISDWSPVAHIEDVIGRP